MSYLETLLKNTSQDTTTTYTWRDFYPSLDPTKWEIEVRPTGGVVGRRKDSNTPGITGFYLPIEVLDIGPTKDSMTPIDDTWKREEVDLNGDLWEVKRKGVAETARYLEKARNKGIKGIKGREDAE